MHISERAVDPPGDARADFDIWLDYARRMDFRDRDGEPLIKWTDPESAFEAWKRCSRGRPCDYSGIGYADLRSGSGIQWPCTERAPDGTERLYVDGTFNTDPEYSEGFGHDLSTGAGLSEDEYRAKEPRGRAFLHAADYEPSPEVPDDERPLLLTTGRTVYHFHTRTKTARAPELAAAPGPWAELAPEDAAELGITDGDPIRIRTARGEIQVPARLNGIRPGVVFVPFHYGYWDLGEAPGPDAAPGRAANELTLSAWDPASKQPLFKVAAASVAPIEAG